MEHLHVPQKAVRPAVLPHRPLCSTGLRSADRDRLFILLIWILYHNHFCIREYKIAYKSFKSFFIRAPIVSKTSFAPGQLVPGAMPELPEKQGKCRKTAWPAGHGEVRSNGNHLLKSFPAPSCAIRGTITLIMIYTIFPPHPADPDPFQQTVRTFSLQ